MYSEMHYFRDLSTIIDDIHDLFDGCEAQHTLRTSLPLEALHVAKLAVHEWVANILQHADFRGRRPEVGVYVSPCNNRLFCMIEDNSEGFDLEGYLEEHPQITSAMPDRGMGLLMLKACTEELRYAHYQGGRHQLEFYVTAQQEAYLEIPFHD